MASVVVVWHVVGGQQGADAGKHGVGPTTAHLGDGSTNTHEFLNIGGGHGSISILSTTRGGGFLGCSVILSMIVCGCFLTRTRSIISPGGVGFLLTHLLTIGGGVGSLNLSTCLLGGETTHETGGGGW